MIKNIYVLNQVKIGMGINSYLVSFLRVIYNSRFSVDGVGGLDLDILADIKCILN